MKQREGSRESREPGERQRASIKNPEYREFGDRELEKEREKRERLGFLQRCVRATVR